MLIICIKLFSAVALVDFLVVLLYRIERKTSFTRLSYPARQLIIGTLFGLLAIYGTEFGIDIGGATVNVRDAAPLSAGLIFGAPAGIISGLIGGIERWFAAYWGAGTYTQLACTLSTILAGLIAALLRKHLFEDKIPGFFYGFGVGLVTEVLHMLMIFLTNMNDVEKAFAVVQKCTFPMVFFNMLAVGVAVALVTLIGKKRIIRDGEQPKIVQTFQRWLIICVLIAFACTCVFVFVLQTHLSTDNARNLLELNLLDIKGKIKEASDQDLLNLTRIIADNINRVEKPDSQLIQDLVEKYELAEIHIVDRNGLITVTTVPEFIGFDMASGEQSAEFLVLLNGSTEFIQDLQPITFDDSILRKFAGVVLLDGGFVQVGHDADDLQADIDSQVVSIAHNIHIGENGGLVIVDQNGLIVSDSRGYDGKNYAEIGLLKEFNTTGTGQIFTTQLYGETCFCMSDMVEGYNIMAFIPEDEALHMRNVSAYVTAFMEIILFAVLFTVIYYLIRKTIVENIEQINDSLGQITDGNLDVVVNVRANQEFASLSDDINSTVTTLKRYIAEAAARIDKELEFARAIQASALPSDFPPFPEEKSFDIYASMDPAKEVGGDFYDFYMVDKDHLAFLIADVSGKGIPGAMFMMTAKTLLKSLAEAGLSVDEVMTSANRELCENNDAGMFVTVWFGMLDFKTGVVEFTNAGHNPPLLQRNQENFEFLKSKVSFVLAGLDNMVYTKNQVQLQPGDVLFLYTDGVTEATDTGETLYGESRLKSTLDSCHNMTVEEITHQIRQDVDKFVGNAAQFDDLTILTLKFNGHEEQACATVDGDD